MNELKVLQHCNKCKFCVELVDFFEEGDCVYLISRYSPKTLRSYVAKQEIEHFTEEEACRFLSQIAFSIDKLHSKFMMHRDLRMESVTVKIKKERLYVTLSSFNFAYQLKKNHTVKQSFNVKRSMAPEVRAGESHDIAVDVWALGQMAYQLLCCPLKDEVLSCQTIDKNTGEVIPR